MALCIDCLPYQRKFEEERGPASGLAVHLDLAGVLLDDAVGDREPESGAAALSLAGSVLRRKKWVVDAADMFLRDAAAAVADDHVHAIAVLRGHRQRSTARHRIFRVEE